MGGGPAEEEEPQSFEAEEVSFVSGPNLKQYPVLSAMASGGFAGFLISHVFGHSALVGSTAGGFIGASLASRDDAIGLKTREASLHIARFCSQKSKEAADLISSHPLGLDAITKTEQVLHLIKEANEEYLVSQKFNSAMTDQVAPRMNGLKNLLLGELHSRGYQHHAQSIATRIDDVTGFTQAFLAVKQEWIGCGKEE